MSEFSPTHLDKYQLEQLKAYAKYAGTSMVGPSGVRRTSPRQMNRDAAQIRDSQLWKMPILPGAVQIFQQMASGREWQVIGKVRPALRAVDWLNSAKTVDQGTGVPTYGFEDFLKRRSLDFIAVGKTTFGLKRKKGSSIPELHYLDPTQVLFNRRSSYTGEVKPTEKVYHHYEDVYALQDVITSYTLPIGTGGYYISPIAYILPTATLAWLVREHDMAATDGRRIRDIIIVGNTELSSSIENAILQQLALHSGEDPTKIGIPIIEMNNLSGGPIEDQIYTLGLSKIPENFNREEFTFDYVNQIAGALGMSLRHFWNNERTTNRALEEIQEQRQAQKGPASFVRTEQRLINQSKVLSLFTQGRGNLSFSFIEEVDTNSAKNNAQVLSLTASALKTVSEVFQASLSLEALLAWMQSIRVLPNDLELIASVETEKPMNPDQQNMPDISDGEQISTEDSAPSSSSSESSEKTIKAYPDYDEVAVDQDGKVRERRHKIFSIRKLLEHEISKTIEPIVVTDEEEDFENAVQLQQKNNNRVVKNYIKSRSKGTGGLSISAPFFESDKIESAMTKLLSDAPLSEEEQAIIDFMSDRIPNE